MNRYDTKDKPLLSDIQIEAILDKVDKEQLR